MLEKAQGGDARAIKALRNSKPQASSLKATNKHDDNPSSRQQHRTKLIDEFNSLRERVWEYRLLSGKQKYKLNQYINKRQTKVLATISGVGWNAYLRKQAGHGDTTAQTALTEKNNLSDAKTDSVDISVAILARVCSETISI